MTSNLRLLYLEQNETDAGMVLAFLAEEGINCQARRVETLEGFADALKDGGFDLVLSDHSDPLNGLAALSIARQIHPELPFIFLTDRSDRATAATAIKIGAADYLPKGRLSHLPPAVKKALAESEDRRRHRTRQAASIANDPFRSLADNLAIGISLLGPDMEILFMNRVMQEWFPHIDPSCRHVCYKKFNSPPRETVCSYCPVVKTFADGAIHESTTETPVNGEIRNYKIITSPVRDRDGTIVAVIEMVEDVTERKQTAEDIRHSRELLRAVVTASPLATILIDPQGHVILWNTAAERIFGWCEAEVLGRHLPSVPDDKHEEFANLRSRVLRGEFLTGVEIRRRNKGGDLIEVSLHAAPVCNSDGTVVAIMSVMADITERKRVEQELQRSEQKFRAAFEDAAIGMCLTGIDGHFLTVNRAFAAMLGYAPEEMTSFDLFRVTHPDDLEKSRHWLKTMLFSDDSPAQMEKRYVTREGRTIWGLVSKSLLHDGQGAPLYFINQIQDITEQKNQEEQLRHMATHDALTGLANRALLLDRLEQSIQFARRSGRIVAVLLLDLDRFKVINDSLGHSFGDQMLCAVAQRLRQNVREADTVARLGGDEFVVLLAEVAQEEDVGLVAAKILHNLAEPLLIDGREITMTASLGIGLYPKDSDDGAKLIRNADIAMYRAKSDERSTFAFYSPEMNRRILETLELECALRQALDLEEFRLHYQPKVELASGRVIGCEALVRWQHPQRGMMSPAEFIPLAEETGLIVPLGAWVLKEACRQAKAWHAEGFPTVSVAVNLSARQFRKGDLPQLVHGILHDFDLEPHLLELELTESMVMNDPAGAEQIMRNLKSLGVRLSLDDFGTGYSSLNYLRRFPVDSLKIDRSFIRDVATEASGASVVNSVIDIAHNLGLTAVAEGVETREQLFFLAGCGCDMLQGYLFSKPLPAENFAEMLRAGKRLAIL